MTTTEARTDTTPGTTLAQRFRRAFASEQTIGAYRYPLFAIFTVAVGAGLLTVVAVVALIH